MPCGWVPGMPTHETVERDRREAALYEAGELVNWIQTEIPSVMEYVPQNLDSIGQLCTVIENLGEERFTQFMIDNLDTSSKASQCLHWWSKHKESDKKRKQKEEELVIQNRRNYTIKTLNNTLKDMTDEQLEKVLEALSNV